MGRNADLLEESELRRRRILLDQRELEIRRMMSLEKQDMERRRMMLPLDDQEIKKRRMLLDERELEIRRLLSHEERSLDRQRMLPPAEREFERRRMPMWERPFMDGYHEEEQFERRGRRLPEEEPKRKNPPKQKRPIRYCNIKY